ncbi:MAG: RimK family alpha-L-glutamate ligase [Clostridiales bacterium]|jgi:RimK family alpha-L-glutamate ligase|nr:RimK family alpha-L-glutamate ligase [Clostridiales bacterium]
MKGLLIYNQFLLSPKFSEVNALYLDAAARLGVDMRAMSNREWPVMLPFEWRRPVFDFVLFLDKDIRLARALELSGYRVVNSSRCISVCDNKSDMYIALAHAGVPVPQTMLAPFTYDNVGYYSYEFLTAAEERLGFPMIVKESYGSFGQQVYLAEDKSDLLTIVKHIKSKPFLMQRFLSESRGWDIRINIVGGKVVGCMRRENKTDFRSNLTLGGKATPHKASGAEMEVARAAARAVDADFCGVDLLYDDGKPVVCEVNANCHIKTLLETTGINAAEATIHYLQSATQH